MDPRTFDTIVKQLAEVRSRRSVVAGSLGAALLAITAVVNEAQGKNRRARHSKGKRRAKHDTKGNNHKHRKQKQGKAGNEQCIELGKKCRKHGEPCCDGAKCRTLLGLPLIPGKCLCPEGTRECAGGCIPESNCCVDNDCGAGAVCQSGSCVPCGAVGQPCCAGGACTEGVCDDGVCVPPCTPDCAGKTCGPDGCGGSCGSCTLPFVCDVTQNCAPPCDVCPTGCVFTSVQAAIDAAGDGDTLTLCAGTFAENIFIYKNLTLIGAGDGPEPASNTILQGTGGGTGAGTTVFVNPITATLQNLRITGGNAQVGGGIRNNGKLTLSVCTVTGNHGDNGGGIDNASVSAADPSTLTLIASTVSDNTAILGGGIFNAVDSMVTIDAASSVTGNQASSDGGGINNEGTVSCAVNGAVSGNTAGTPGAENCFDFNPPNGGSGCNTCNP